MPCAFDGSQGRSVAWKSVKNRPESTIPLLAIALLTSFLSARRAARIDPVIMLRE